MMITIETTVRAPLDATWRAWTTPDEIVLWNAASDDWHTTAATVDLRVGGVFSSRMEAKDGSEGFDFEGTYTEVVPRQRIAYEIADGRGMVVEFVDVGGAVWCARPSTRRRPSPSRCNAKGGRPSRTASRDTSRRRHRHDRGQA